MSAQKDTSKETQFEFQAEVSRLLGIVTNALYSNKDIFLRELVSNASDACDKLRYESLTNPALKTDQDEFSIDLGYDTDARTITVADNGIGMNRDDLIENLGTIARSGTAKLMEQLKSAQSQQEGSSGAAPNLIGQFGVGFYASFMVADHVDVITRKAGEEDIWHWASDGVSGYSLEQANAEQAALLPSASGTVIILHLKDDASDYLIPEKLQQIISTYSDHVAFKINLKKSGEDTEKQQINSGSAIWARSKSELSDDDYNQYYQSLTYGMDEPLLTLHWTAEGKIEYTGLLYVPTMRPFDMFDPSRRHAVRLYVKRIFITDDCENLVFPWLRFLRGVIDCQDLQLNISREMLQHNPMIHMIRRGIARKVLGELLKLSRNDEAAYETFWGQFGMVLKEGLYDAIDHQEDLFKLCRFYSTETEGLTGLEDYVERMKDGQDKIYYITGENAEALKKSPQIEGYRARGIEVLLMTDTIDSFWLQNALEFKDHLFQSVTKGEADLDQFDAKDDSAEDKSETKDNSNKDNANSDIENLIALLKENLSEDVGDVRISKRLHESPVCLIASDQGVDMHMENVLKIQQHYQPTAKRVMEINADHDMIKALAANIVHESGGKEPPIAKDDAAQFLLDQAKILQGEKLEDPARFAHHLSALMQKAFK